MKFLKGLLISLFVLMLGILASTLIFTEGLKATFLKPALAHKIIDEFPLQEVAPEILSQYLNAASATEEIPFEFSEEDIEGVVVKVLTDEFELYLKTQLNDAVTKFYAFMNSETDELNIEISIPDITEQIFESMPLLQIFNDFDLPFDMCEDGGTDCIDLEDLNTDDLEGMMEKFMSEEQVLGAQDILGEETESGAFPTSISITTDDLPAEILEAREALRIAQYSGWILGGAIFLISALLMALQKWTGLITVGGSLIAVAIPFVIIGLSTKSLEVFFLDIIQLQTPSDMSDFVSTITAPLLTIVEFLVRYWLNFSLIFGGVGIVLTITGMILKKKSRAEETVPKVQEPKKAEVATELEGETKAAVEPKQKKIKADVSTE